MGHWNDARIAIEQYLQANWSATPIRYWSSGIPFVPPATPYIALQIEEFEARQVTLGDGPQVHRYQGIITIQVLIPEGEAAKTADEFCDQLDPLFRRAQIAQGDSGVIVCRTPQKRTVGIRAGWYSVNLIVSYKRDRVH